MKPKFLKLITRLSLENTNKAYILIEVDVNNNAVDVISNFETVEVQNEVILLVSDEIRKNFLSESSLIKRIFNSFKKMNIND